MKKRFCIFTGSRAEYGILSPLIRRLKFERGFQTQLLVSGTHASDAFGSTYQEILKDGLKIDELIKITYKNDSSLSVAESFSEAVAKFSKVLQKRQPHLIILLGDRYETLAMAVASMFVRIPVAHLHGGELTYGAIDEAIRHSITKMSYLHFTSTETYRQRVIQLGEDPKRVFNVGALGVENALGIKSVSRTAFEKQIHFLLNQRNLLITFHSTTLEPESSKAYVQNLLKALDRLKNTHLIFTGSNADMEGAIINKSIKAYVKKNSRKAVFFTSMGQSLYMAAMHHVDAVIGNSSSGIIEAPSFKIGTINIGKRQEGRIAASSVINCQPTEKDISQALKKLYSSAFQKSLSKVVNPYGKGDTTARIVKILKAQKLPLSLGKKFYQTGEA